MLKGVTKRQIIVLYVLVAVLIAVLGIKFAILPMMESNDKKNTELLAKASEYDNLVYESQQAQVYEELNKQLEIDIKNISKSFQSDIKTSNIDAKISSLIKTSGLSAVSLTVNDPVDVTDASLTMGETNGQVQTQTQTQPQTQTEQKPNNATSTVKSITSNVTTSGSYDELVKFIKLVGKQEAMYMTDLTFTMKVDEDSNDDITMNFSIVSFVYTPMPEDTQEQGEEATQAVS